MRSHKIKVAKGDRRPRDVPRMPRRCRGWTSIPCPFRASHWSLTGDLGHSKFFPMCDQHFNYYNRMTRRWRNSEPEAPEIRAMHTDVPTLSGALHPAQDTIYVTQVFAEEDAVRQLFVLAHEHLHLWLRHEFGGATSLALDILYRRSLRCLRGHSMMTYELAALSAQTDPEPTHPNSGAGSAITTAVVLLAESTSGRRVMPKGGTKK